MGYFFHALYPLLRMTNRSVGAEMRAPRWPWIHDLLGRLLYLEERLLPSAWPGTSILVRVRVSRDGFASGER